MFVVLLFHEIVPRKEIPKSPRKISVADRYQDVLPEVLYNSYESFCEQMNYLISEDYHFLKLDEIKQFYEEGSSMPEKSVLITFDDCFQSQKRYAYPFLKNNSIPAVSFEATGWIFDEKQFYEKTVSKTLSFEELNQMKDVFEYANHTHHFHQRKGNDSSRLIWENNEAFVQDLKKCNQYVQVKDVFAYPFGIYNKKNVEILAEMNFKLAFTTVPGINTEKTNPLELHRVIIPEGLPMEIFKQMLGESV
ncbi:polysaccharide deacetylase family protein [Marinilactibacillus sp. GCM10026970]|uniref:polysaccharide deacetylase family protein n=1 Tax=Marinilactibacillus sp. GCM10026970 TaxID=3252642 RepID=UPI00361DA6FD